MAEEKLNRTLIYYNPGDVTNQKRLEMFIYSLEDDLLKYSTNVNNWHIDSDNVETIQNRIEELTEVIEFQDLRRSQISNIETELGNTSLSQEEKSSLRNSKEKFESELIPNEQLQDLRDELTQLNDIGSNYRIDIDIHNNFRTNGFYSGAYKVKYKLIEDLVNNLFIDAISSDRKSIRGKLSWAGGSDSRLRNFFGLIDYNKEPVYQNTDYYLEPAIDLFNETKHSILNWVPVDGRSVIIKFYEPLPTTVQEKDEFRIVMPLSTDINDKVILFGPPPTQEVNVLKPSNFNIRNSFKKKDMKLQSWNDIVSNDYDLSKTLLNKYFGDNTEGIELNVDYREFDNYVFYSNAYDRLETFKYKLETIEGYNSSISELQSTITSSASSSLEFLNNITKYKTKRDDIINKFDDYEKYLYFESSSYETSSFGEWYPTSWPKTTQYKPHTLYHSTSSIATDWYTGILSSASLYDKNNQNALVRTIPEHIREDEFSNNYETFVSMVGHQMDTLWLYTKHLSNLKDRDESLYEGLSKDLVYSVLSSYGWDGINDMQYDDLWYYSLGTNESGSNIFTGSVASSQSLHWITAVSESISSGDLQKETWKRILNNLPYLNKTKGTKEGIRALINCYGIPSTELRIREYGGPEPLNNLSYYEYRKFTYALQIDPACQVITTQPDHDGTIEFRFKTDYPGAQNIYQNIGNPTPDLLKIYIDGNGSMSIDTSGGTSILDTHQAVNDGKWWSFMMTLDTGNTHDVYLKRAEYSKIIQAYSTSVDVGGVYPGTPLYEIGGGTFSGSIQEFRLWNSSISETTFNNHVLAPTAYNGDNYTSSFDNLYYRLTFGTDTKRYNHSLTSSLDSQHPNFRNEESASFVGFPNKYNYEPVEETYKQAWPDISANRTISNKVRVEDNEVTGALHVNKRVETSTFDIYPLDNPKVGVYLGPTNEVDQDIAEFMGGARIDDFIGSYENYYTNEYPELRDLRQKYFSQYQGQFNTIDYFRLLNYFNTSIFKQIKEIIPGRAKALTGVVVEPHILNRSKVSILYQRPVAENTTKEVELGVQDQAFFYADNKLYEPNFAFYKTGSSDYYWHNIVYTAGVPTRVENPDYLQQAQQIFYEEERRYDYNKVHYPILSGSNRFIITPISGSGEYYFPSGSLDFGDSSGSYDVWSDLKLQFSRPFRYIPQAVKNHTFVGCKITSTGFNIPSDDTPDNSPVISFTETSELIMRTQNPDDSGNLIVE